MPRKKQSETGKRRDSKGRLLRTGESERKDGTYQFRYTDSEHVHRCVYARTLEDLRWKEGEIQACRAM